MPIEIKQEHLLSLSDAARKLPAVDGKRPHTSTLWRWCRKGLRGVHLEYVRLGHRVCTSESALSRFVNALAEADQQQPPAAHVATAPSTAERTTAARQIAVARAREALKREGL